MKVNKVSEGTKLTVSIEGRLDTTTAPQLEEDVKGSLADVTELIIDMTELQYISSAGLRVLLSLQKIMTKQGKLIVRNVCEDINEIFEMTGFSDILTIE